MANMVLLKIGNTDVTGWLDIQNFKMDRADVYDSWSDGNGMLHRNFSRTRITGKAAAGFSSAADFSAFCTLIENERHTDGYFTVTAYVNNTGTTETFEAFIELTATSKWDWVNNRRWIVQNMTIMQR